MCKEEVGGVLMCRARVKSEVYMECGGGRGRCVKGSERKEKRGRGGSAGGVRRGCKRESGGGEGGRGGSGGKGG